MEINSLPGLNNWKEYWEIGDIGVQYPECIPQWERNEKFDRENRIGKSN